MTTRFDESIPLARTIARSETRRFAPAIPFDDVMQGALMGLWRATEEFDDTRGEWIKFAAFRMRWGIIDYVVRPYFGRNGRALRLVTCEFDDALEHPGFAEVDDADEVAWLDKAIETAGLTTRERLVVACRRRGWTYPEIGRALGVTQEMAYKHRKKASGKLTRLFRRAN